MFLRFALIALLMTTAGAVGWALYERNRMGTELLSTTYFDAALTIKNNVYVLTNLRKGQRQNAITYLERQITSRASILEGCKKDLCLKSTPAEYVEALQLVAAYNAKYGSK
jgi:Tfp pilus assembly protein PilF